MVRSFLVLCLSMSLIHLNVPRAAACINDRDTRRTEHEFRTNYEFKSSEFDQKSMSETPAVSAIFWPITLGGALTWAGYGMGFLAGGFVVCNLRRVSGS